MREKQETVKITTEFLRMTEEYNSNFDRNTNGYKQITVDMNWMNWTTPIVTLHCLKKQVNTLFAILREKNTGCY